MRVSVLPLQLRFGYCRWRVVALATLRNRFTAIAAKTAEDLDLSLLSWSLVAQCVARM